MKNFDDFVNMLEPDIYQVILSKANQAMLVTKRCEVEDNAFFIALELLNLYHRWINEE